MRASIKSALLLALLASGCGDQTPKSDPAAAAAVPSTTGGQRACTDPVKMCGSAPAMVDPASCMQICADGSTPK